MNQHKAEKIASIWNEIKNLSSTIIVQKNSAIKLENGTTSPLIASPQSTIHEAVMLALEKKKRSLEKELEDIT